MNDEYFLDLNLLMKRENGGYISKLGVYCDRDFIFKNSFPKRLLDPVVVEGIVCSKRNLILKKIKFECPCCGTLQDNERCESCNNNKLIKKEILSDIDEIVLSSWCRPYNKIVVILKEDMLDKVKGGEILRVAGLIEKVPYKISKNIQFKIDASQINILSEYDKNFDKVLRLANKI